MATYGSADIGYFIANGISLLGVVTDVSDTVEALTEDGTVLGVAWNTPLVVGVKRFELTQSGFYDDSAGVINAGMVAAEGVLQVVMLAYEGNTLGKHVTGFQGPLQSKYVRGVARDALHKAHAEYVGSGASETGRIVHVLAAETTPSGNTQSTPVDNAASSANGGAAYLEVTAIALGGYTDVTIKARHSADNITYADLATFANVSVVGGQRVTFAGTVNRYVAASWLFNGSGSSESITFTVGVARG